MRSSVPKPLQLVNGRPMVSYVVDAIAGLEVERRVVVVGHQGSLVKDTLSKVTDSGDVLEFVEQKMQNGTAQAVRIALGAFDQEEFQTDEGNMMVLPADMPLLTTETLAQLKEHHFDSGAAATLLTAEFGDPSGYGRIVRGQSGRVDRVVEHADASREELDISEVNTSVYCFKSKLLLSALQNVQSKNSQNEYYLTDVIELLNTMGNTVRAVTVDDSDEVRGVNDSRQLAECESLLMDRSNAK
tara:strand:- start:10628 stop:11356 length:729 start_codon:yes stop_codon:yes gene_type:complete